MLLSKLSQMSVGPLWVRRDRGHQQAAEAADSVVSICSGCGQSWLQFSSDDNKALVVLPAPVTDPAQQTLLQNCLQAVGWGDVAVMSLHSTCLVPAETATQALQAQLVELSPATVIVFGIDAAHRIHPDFNRGSIYPYQNSRLIVTYHPEQMLADPTLKAAVWADLCLAAYDVGTSA